MKKRKTESVAVDETVNNAPINEEKVEETVEEPVVETVEETTEDVMEDETTDVVGDTKETEETTPDKKQKALAILKKIWNRYFIDAFTGMAQGLFCTLIAGTILAQIASWCGDNSFAKAICTSREEFSVSLHISAVRALVRCN